MTKALIYARVSTDEQAEHGYSLRHQTEACQRYADIHGLDVVDIISDDYTGMKIERPGFSELLSKLSNGQADTVIVYMVKEERQASDL